MRKNRKYFLVQEYRLVQKQLNRLQAEYIRIQTVLEIIDDLEKRINSEVEAAKANNDLNQSKYWQDILKHYLTKDKDRPAEGAWQKIQSKATDEHNKFCSYYEMKLAVIRRALGEREAELIESYDEKKLLIGDDNSANKLAQSLQEEANQPSKDDNDFTFGKM